MSAKRTTACGALALAAAATVLSGCAGRGPAALITPTAQQQCGTAAPAPAPALRRVRTAMRGLPPSGGFAAQPFGVVTAPGRWAFVSVVSGVDVLATRQFRPRLVRHIPVPQALGEALAPDGRYLLVASARGMTVISVRRAEAGGAHAVLGTLAVPHAQGPIEVTVSPDGTLAFVSVEYSNEIAVFRLSRALARGFGPADLVGTIPTGDGAVGMAISPDGRWLYATSEQAAKAPPGGRPGDIPGTLSVISVPQAARHPARSVVAVRYADCQPVRVVLSRGGRIAWVTARASNAVLAFDTARLRTAPRSALLADVRVGIAPVGLILVRRSTRLIVADSNRFAKPPVPSNLAVLSVAAALAHRPALLGYIPAGKFPRQFAAEPGGQTLLVTNFLSGQLQAVGLSRLP
jgi:DNA-binding beta-propeller fold protein YncE